MRKSLAFGFSILLASFAGTCNAADATSIFGAILGQVVGRTVGKTLATPPQVEAALSKMAQEVNAEMPITVDRETRLDNVLAGPGRLLTYNYTIVNLAANEIDQDYFVSFVKRGLLKDICPKQAMQVFFKNGVTLGYSYRGNDGRLITRQDLSPKDCGFGGKQ